MSDSATWIKESFETIDRHRRQRLCLADKKIKNAERLTVLYEEIAKISLANMKIDKEIMEHGEHIEMEKESIELRIKMESDDDVSRSDN